MFEKGLLQTTTALYVISQFGASASATNRYDAP